MINLLGFDPGKDKCGVAIMKSDRSLIYHQVILSSEVIKILVNLCEKHQIHTIIMGDQTTAKKWQKQLKEQIPNHINIVMVDERYTSLKARDRYWQMNPAKGLTKLIPQGMREISSPIDDIVAILLIEKYLDQNFL